jgi:hypothetical protein
MKIFSNVIQNVHDVIHIYKFYHKHLNNEILLMRGTVHVYLENWFANEGHNYILVLFLSTPMPLLLF